jgi:hypothetical protein
MKIGWIKVAIMNFCAGTIKLKNKRAASVTSSK